MAKVLHAITFFILVSEVSRGEGINETATTTLATVSTTTLSTQHNSTDAHQTSSGYFSTVTTKTETTGTLPSHSPSVNQSDVSTHPSWTSATSHQGNSSISEGPTTTPAVKNDSTGAPARSSTYIFSSSQHPTSHSAGSVNTSSTTVSYGSGRQAANAGLVSVLCVFFIVLALVLFVVIVKAIRSRKPQFERLDDLPMNKMNEDAPFAKYSPN